MDDNTRRQNVVSIIPEPTAADKETKEILERIAKWKKKKEEW